MIKIFIPVGGKPAWEELRYCLRSIDKYIPYAHVTIYSDRDIDWLQNVDFKKMDRFYPTNKSPKDYENYWDSSNKILQYSKHNLGLFVYAYDDIVFLRSFNPPLFDNVALQEIYITDKLDGKHGHTIEKAINLLNPIGVPIFNYETHIPRIFGTRNMVNLFDTFDILKQDIPPAISTLYYNYYFDRPRKILAEHNDLRASFTFEEENDQSGCYIACKEWEIEQYCKDKYILHYNDKGLNFAPGGVQILKEYIKKLFPNKCKYEK